MTTVRVPSASRGAGRDAALGLTSSTPISRAIFTPRCVGGVQFAATIYTPLRTLLRSPQRRWHTVNRNL